MTSPAPMNPPEVTTSATDVAVDNYEHRTLYGHTMQYRPGPVAGDPAEIGRQIRQELAERAQA
ncbi:hypothetical protein [Mycobacterium sp. 050134]|uniref:hypothetical protein n=1 Tax=Mycobacterium sp. 050134 TaxID=3096111 RepID=UPI002ED829E8